MQTPRKLITKPGFGRTTELQLPSVCLVRKFCAPIPLAIMLWCVLSIASVSRAGSLSDVQAKAEKGDANSKGVVSVLLQVDAIPAGEGESKAQKALKLAEESAEAGSPFGLYALGRIHGEGVGMKKDADKAKQLYTGAFPGLQKLSEGDDPNAQWLLGVSFNVGRGVEKDQAKAVEWFRKSAEQGNAVAQRLIGQCYLEGEGVEKDQAQAVEWFSKSAQQGCAVAQGLLGWLYLSGEVVEKDQTKAVEWFSKSAEQDNATSQWYLAWRYMSGEGVEKDQAQAVEWFRKSAEQGDADSQRVLGWCYSNGEGVEKNPAEAAKWYLKAAEQGDKQAMRNLASMEGSALDTSEKNLWLYRAAESDEELHDGPETKDVMALTVGGQLRDANQPPKGLFTVIKEGLSGEFKTRRLRGIFRAEPHENSGRKVYPVRLVFEGPDGGEERWNLVFFKDEFGQWSAETAKHDASS
jgi:TPR repeat protein